MIDVKKIAGIGEFVVESRKTSEAGRTEADDSGVKIYKVKTRAFLVVNKNTLEVRTDGKLGKFLTEKYESVMRSRYFGKGGIEIVDSGQLGEDEVEDLIRLSYNLTKEMEEEK